MCQAAVPDRSRDIPNHSFQAIFVLPGPTSPEDNCGKIDIVKTCPNEWIQSNPDTIHGGDKSIPFKKSLVFSNPINTDMSQANSGLVKVLTSCVKTNKTIQPSRLRLLVMERRILSSEQNETYEWCGRHVLCPPWPHQPKPWLRGRVHNTEVTVWWELVFRNPILREKERVIKTDQSRLGWTNQTCDSPLQQKCLEWAQIKRQRPVLGKGIVAIIYLLRDMCFPFAGLLVTQILPRRHLLKTKTVYEEPGLWVLLMFADLKRSATRQFWQSAWLICFLFCTSFVRDNRLLCLDGCKSYISLSDLVSSTSSDNKPLDAKKPHSANAMVFKAFM